MSANDRRFPDIERFYDAHPDPQARRFSPEVDFGVWWRLGRNNITSSTWRVSLVVNTGELYAVRLGGHGIDYVRSPKDPIEEGEYVQVGANLTVVLLANLRCTGDASRALADYLLDGWADAIQQRDSLIWLVDRLGDYWRLP